MRRERCALFFLMVRYIEQSSVYVKRQQVVRTSQIAYSSYDKASEKLAASVLHLRSATSFITPTNVFAASRLYSTGRCIRPGLLERRPRRIGAPLMSIAHHSINDAANCSSDQTGYIANSPRSLVAVDSARTKTRAVHEPCGHPIRHKDVPTWPP